MFYEVLVSNFFYLLAHLYFFVCPCVYCIFRPTIEGGVSEVEIISQQVEEETKSIAPVQLVNFAYRDLPLAALDLSVAGSQLLSNLDEEYQREG